MRKHEIYCVTEGDKQNQNLQEVVNEFTLIYIKQAVCKNGLPRKEQLTLLDELIDRVTESCRRQSSRPQITERREISYADRRLQQKIQMDR